MASLSDETLAYVATLTNFDSSLFLGIIFILVIVIPPFFYHIYHSKASIYQVI